MSSDLVLPRTKHHVTVDFDIDVSPQLAHKVKCAVAKAVHCALGYPGNGLDVDYSFNNPSPPKTVKVVVSEVKSNEGNRS